MFLWLWITLWSAIVLPLAALFLSGRVPQWMRRQSTPGALKVKGIAALVLYVALLIPPVTALSGIRSEDADFLRMVLVPVTVFGGNGLVLGATLCERFNRRDAERAGSSVVRSTWWNGRA